MSQSIVWLTYCSVLCDGGVEPAVLNHGWNYPGDVHRLADPEPRKEFVLEKFRVTAEYLIDPCLGPESARPTCLELPCERRSQVASEWRVANQFTPDQGA